jgi:hypothetical protein
MAEMFKLEPVPEETDPPEAGKSGSDAGMTMLMMGLGALSKRALAAMPALFAVPAVGSAFLLWFLTPKPDVYQIVSLTIYALFVLTACWLVRTR